MCKLEECAIVSKLSDLVNKNKKDEVVVVSEKKPNGIVIALAVIGAIVAIAGIAYAVYRYLTPDYLDDFEDEFEDDEFEDDFFDETDVVEE